MVSVVPGLYQQHSRSCRVGFFFFSFIPHCFADGLPQVRRGGTARNTRLSVVAVRHTKSVSCLLFLLATPEHIDIQIHYFNKGKNVWC